MTPGIDPEQVELLPQLIERRASEDPDRLYITEIGGDTATYGSFAIRCRQWAQAFRMAGLEAGDLVVSMQGAGQEELACWIGLSRVGGVLVPLNLDYVGQMLLHALTLTGAKVAVVEREYLSRLEDLGPDASGLELVIVRGATTAGPGRPLSVVAAEELLDAAPADADLPWPDPWDTALVLLTSGTTGPSKGVRIPWAQLRAWSVHQFPLDLMDDSDVWYGPWPSFHITGKYPPYMMALVGGQIVLRDRLSVTNFVDDLTSYGVTTTILALALIGLLEGGETARAETLRHVVMVPVLKEFEEFEHRFGCRISTGYAMTEIGAALISRPGEITAANISSVGRPTPGIEARVVDEHDQVVAPGEIGELIVRSDRPWRLNAGYVGMPEATAEAWRNGWFHTSDAFRYDAEGNFFFLDRMKDCIRRRGENISSFEVEREVDQHPDVAESAAISVPAGDDGEDVKVVVVARSDSLTEAALYQFLVERMPRFMLPRYIELVDELPKTPTQKVRKTELRADALNDRTWCRPTPVAR